MADSPTPLSRTSTPPNDSHFESYSTNCSPLPAARLAGAFLSGGSGRVPFNVTGTSGSGAAPLHADCRMVEVHGLKVASFSVNGVELICLPQVFELFLKHLVGGLHTVYTKLKRLDISPVVCTVEQVRVLRGLGAIQPGVNRCKLITRADFETLYRDCTNASSRPGRPPKRNLGVATMMDGSRLHPYGLISPALLSQTGLTVAMAEALKWQKMRMMMDFFCNGEQRRQHNEAESENDDTGGGEGSWVKEQHLLSPPPLSSSSVVASPPWSTSLQQHSTLLDNRLPPASVAMVINQMSQLNSLANMAAVSHVQRDSKESPPRSPSLTDEELHPQEATSQSASRASSSSSSSPPADLDSQLLRPLLKLTNEKLSISHTDPAFTPFLLADGLSSMETMLTNIQGLLKLALESVRCQDQQSRLERKELKLELERQRDVRQALQRHLSSELHSTGETGVCRGKRRSSSGHIVEDSTALKGPTFQEVKGHLHPDHDCRPAELPGGLCLVSGQKAGKQQNT